MRTSILNLIRKSGIISFNDIIYALNLQTEYNEAATNSVSPNGGLCTLRNGVRATKQNKKLIRQ